MINKITTMKTYIQPQTNVIVLSVKHMVAASKMEMGTEVITDKDAVLTREKKGGVGGGLWSDMK